MSVSIAVWGLGRHALRNILPALAGGAGFVLRGVCSRNPGNVQAVCAEYSCLGWTDPADMLASPELDAIYVATPSGLHARHVAAVLSAGKHAWCEKPLVQSATDAEHLAELAEKHAVTVAEGFMYLYHPQFARLSRIVNCELGRIDAVTCRFGIPTLEKPGFRNDPALGGGAFLDLGCYPISTLVALFPGLRPEIGYVEIGADPGSAVDTRGVALLRYQNGPQAVLEWRTGSAYRNEIDAWGTEGSVFCDRAFSKAAEHAPQLRVSDRHGNTTFEICPAANHFSMMFEAFRRMIYDSAAAALERRRIVERSRLMDMIIAHWEGGLRGRLEKRAIG
jgi:dTDP-3,4-didehydro-2,6-dideoxy-alpha-D-glucose 3-reductase